MHLLISTSRDHVLQYAKLLVHLRPSPSLDQAVCSLPGDLAPCSRGIVGLFPLAASGLLCWSFRILLLRLRFRRFLNILGLHLYDLA